MSRRATLVTVSALTNDVLSFYGINLNQNFVLQQIGFGGTTGTTWNKLFKITTGNMIITALGFLPGARPPRRARTRLQNLHRILRDRPHDRDSGA